MKIVKNFEVYKGYTLKIADDYWKGDYHKETAQYINTEKVFRVGVGLGALDITTVCCRDVKRNLCKNQ